MIEIILSKNSNLLLLPEKVYGTVKRIGMLNNEPILYGDINVVKPGSLYYIPGAKQIYRYIKAIITSDITYLFTTIEQTSTDSLMIPEDERGTIRNAGYLFNEIIYSGDPNLVENGNLFYHDTLPYVSIISNVDGIINLSTKEIDENGEITTVITEYRVSPQSQHDYSNDYLTFEALEDGTFTLTIGERVTPTYMKSISYSINEGNTWVTTDVDSTKQTITTPTINAGDKVLWKGVGIQLTIASSPKANITTFSSTCNFNISGNIMSLLYNDDFKNLLNFKNESSYIFSYLFSDAVKLISASNLILPVTTLVNNCYNSMFYNCSALIAAPTLPATKLADSCYYNMFKNCSLLTTVSELPAIELIPSCYNGMFSSCTSLTTAPELPATTLTASCYNQMFKNCTLLNYIKALFLTTPSSTYTSNWVAGVSENGIFVKNSTATWNVTGMSGIPSGWTVETADSEPSDEITI